MARLDRDAMTVTSYGPKQGGGYYQRRPGAPLVPIDQAYLEDRQGLDGVYGLNEGLNDAVAPERNYTLFASQGARPRDEKAWIIQVLKGYGYHDPPSKLVDAMASVLDYKNPKFLAHLDRFVGSVIAEQKIYARDPPAYPGSVLENATTAYRRGLSAGGQGKTDVVMLVTLAVLGYVLYRMVS